MSAPRGAFDEEGRRYQADLIDELAAHDPAKGIDVERPARDEGAWQVPVADDHRSVAHEGGVAKDVVWMAVGVDEVSEGLPVRVRIAASSRCPSRTLPPLSITATALSPMMNPTLAIAPSFSPVMSAVWPV